MPMWSLKELEHPNTEALSIKLKREVLFMELKSIKQIQQNSILSLFRIKVQCHLSKTLDSQLEAY
jgi:hypothetical protein